MDLDETDRKILKILQADGRTALSEIARRLEMGSATIHERVTQLETEGYLRGYHGVLDPELLEMNTIAFVRVTSEPGRASEVAELLAEEPTIQEVHEITGQTDLLLKSRVANREALSDLMTQIGRFDGVTGTASEIVLRNIKEEHTIPITDR